METGVIFSNPWSVLPIKNMKYARSCTEIHLSDSGIDKIANFENFPSIETLYLNNNKVRLSFRFER